jgi:hypothetical protein
MTPNDYCFYQLGKRIISDNLTEQLICFSKEETTIFHKLWYSEDTGEVKSQGYQVCVMTDYLIFKFPEILKIRNKFSVKPSQIVIVKQLANTSAFIHTDGNYKRRAVLATPLVPLTNFSPTLFYKTTAEDSLYQSCNYQDNCSVFLNTQKYHSVKTTDQERLNFQFAFNMPYTELVKMVLDNKFIKE